MIRKSTNELSIKPKMSRNTVVASLILGVFAMLALVYFVYDQGLSSGHDRLKQDQTMITQLNDTIIKLHNQLSISQESLIFSKRQQQIQSEAYKQMSKAYSNAEKTKGQLVSKVDFYRSIISPENGQSGPAIQDFEYQYDKGKLDFDITLVQAIQHKHQVRGGLRVTLFENDVATAQWPLSSVRSVNYQYSRIVSGSFEKVVIAKNVKLKVELNLQGGAVLERWFNVSNVADSNENNDNITSG
ncbi:MAG: isochorismate synthase EntC [Arenicella sp.]|jgi:isochorismate synthase EntC